MRLSFDEDGMAMVYDGEPQGAGDLEIGGLLLHHGAQEDLRAALCPPDPAAESRAKLEQAVRDGVIGNYTCGYDVLGYGAIIDLRGRRQWNTEHYPTEAEALAAAAAHVEGMREVVPEPEAGGMTIDQLVAEMEERGWRKGVTSRGLLVWSRNSDGDAADENIQQGPNDHPLGFHRFAVRHARR